MVAVLEAAVEQRGRRNGHARANPAQDKATRDTHGTPDSLDHRTVLLVDMRVRLDKGRAADLE